MVNEAKFLSLLITILVLNCLSECCFVLNNTLRSPGYPNNYPSNTDCNYSIPIPPGMAMKIYFQDFVLEPSFLSCRFDYMKISNENGHTFAVYCGHMTGKTVSVTGSHAVITFHSDSSIQKRGFILNFTHTPPAPPRVLKQENVMLALPGYTLSCQATGILPIYTALIKNSTVLVNTTNIASITIAEQGNYSCVATNMFGTDTKVISVMFFACIWNQQVHYDGDHWQENGVDFYCTGHSSEKVRPGCYVETNRVKCTGVMPGIRHLAKIYNESLFLCGSGDEIRSLKDRCDTHPDCDDQSDEKDCLHYYCSAAIKEGIQLERTQVNKMLYKMCSLAHPVLEGTVSFICRRLKGKSHWDTMSYSCTVRSGNNYSNLNESADPTTRTINRPGLKHAFQAFVPPVYVKGKIYFVFKPLKLSSLNTTPVTAFMRGLLQASVSTVNLNTTPTTASVGGWPPGLVSTVSITEDKSHSKEHPNIVS